MTNELKGELSVVTGMNQQEVDLVKRTVAKGTTDLELAYFLKVAQSVGLNPLTKEIWCYKDGKGNVLSFASKDGFRKVAQKNPNFKSINSVEVCSDDKFEMGTNNGEMFINHSFGSGSRGVIIGAYAIISLNNGGKIIEWADIETYDKNQFVWNSHKAEMIKKVAEVHAIKKMSNLSGLYAEEEFKIIDGKIIDHDNVSTEDNASKLLSSIQEKEKPFMDDDKFNEIMWLVNETASDIEGLKKFIGGEIMTMDKEKYNTVKKMLDKKMQEKAVIVPEIVVDSNVPDTQEEIIIDVPDEPVVDNKKETPQAKAMREGMERYKSTTKNNNNNPFDFKNYKKQQTEVFVPVPGDVCQYINEMTLKPETEWPEGFKELNDDCTSGKFKGKESYKCLSNLK